MKNSLSVSLPSSLPPSLSLSLSILTAISPGEPGLAGFTAAKGVYTKKHFVKDDKLIKRQRDRQTENALYNVLVTLVSRWHSQLVNVDDSSISCSPQRTTVRLSCNNIYHSIYIYRESKKTHWLCTGSSCIERKMAIRRTVLRITSAPKKTTETFQSWPSLC